MSMPAETIGAQDQVLAAAKESLTFASAPLWKRPCPFREDFKARQPGHQTHLLVDRQVNAEERQTFVHGAIRLETLQGVHRHSQWRLDFDPQCQSVAIHSVKIHRGSLQTEQALADRVHIVNRDAGPDQLDVEGVAALLILEDVRPGDILEWAYTVHEKSPLLAEFAMAMFTAPPSAAIGCFHFSIRFRQTRPMKWKSSSGDLCPEETLEKADIVWIWNRENFHGNWLEENTPEWHIDYPWVQVSDCPDWETVSTALAARWRDDPNDSSLAAVAKKIAREDNNIHRQIEHAIEFVQDEFRALPSDAVSFLQPPATPAVIVRRRFGESKDLAFLLSRLLLALNITSRPVLVSSVWRKSLASLLPMPLFDRALVEYQALGETRWVDPTAKRQGGGSLHRVICDYGAGLPVTASSRLQSAPQSDTRASVYELKESILLDTSGSPSWMSVTVTATGSHAEAFRREFEMEGAAAIARKRLQHFAARFNNARRIGEMEFRDDRASNVFVLAEGYEINDFLVMDAKPGLCRLAPSNDFLLAALKMPDPETRRTPFALPYPTNLVYIVEVHCLALPPGIVQSRDIDSEFVRFTRFRRTLAGDWTIKFTLSTLTDAVPPGQIEQYRETLRELRSEASWSLLAPVGQPRPHQRSDFGKIPTSFQKEASPPPAPAAVRPPVRSVTPTPPALAGGRAHEISHSPNGTNGDKPAQGSNGGAAAGAPETRYKRRKRHRRRHRSAEGKMKGHYVAISLAVTVVALLLIYFCAKDGAPKLPSVPMPDAPVTTSPQ